MCVWCACCVGWRSTPLLALDLRPCLLPDRAHSPTPFAATQAGIVGDFLARQKQHLLKRQQKSAEMLHEMQRQKAKKVYAKGPPKMLERDSIKPPGGAPDGHASHTEPRDANTANAANAASALPHLPHAQATPHPALPPGSPTTAAVEGDEDTNTTATATAIPGSPGIERPATSPRGPTQRGRINSASRLRPATQQSANQAADKLTSVSDVVDRLCSPSKKAFSKYPCLVGNTCTCKSLNCDHPSHRQASPRKKFVLAAKSRKHLAKSSEIRKIIDTAASKKKIFTVCGRVGGLDDARRELLERGWIEKPPPREGDPFTHHELPDGIKVLTKKKSKKIKDGKTSTSPISSPTSGNRGGNDSDGYDTDGTDSEGEEEDEDAIARSGSAVAQQCSLPFLPFDHFFSSS